MITLTQGEIGLLLLRALFLGVILGIFYDFLRFGKSFFFVRYDGSVPNHLAKRTVAVAVTFLADLVFWITVGVVSVLLLYGYGDGVFRGVIYPLLGVGFLAYALTLGRLVRRFFSKLSEWIRMGTKKLFCLLSVPLKSICRALISLYHLTIGRILGKIKENIRIARNRHAERKRSLPAETENEEELPRGKEAYVYVDGKIGYRKEGRIRFGS